MKVIKRTKTLSAVGPYSLAIEKGGILFLSGQIGINKEIKLVEGGIEAEFGKIMENTIVLLNKVGYSMSDIVQIKNYLIRLEDFSTINNLYKKYFQEPYPTRTTFQVVGIPLGASIEVEITAIKDKR